MVNVISRFPLVIGTPQEGTELGQYPERVKNRDEHQMNSKIKNQKSKHRVSVTVIGLLSTSLTERSTLTLRSAGRPIVPG